MTADEPDEDRVAQALAGLTRHDPDPARQARVRGACRRRMGRQRWSMPGIASSAQPSALRAWEPVLVGAISAAFLLDVFWRALLLARF